MGQALIFVILLVIWGCKFKDQPKDEENIELAGLPEQFDDEEAETVSLLLTQVQVFDVSASKLLPENDSLSLTGHGAITRTLTDTSPTGGSKVGQLADQLDQQIGSSMQQQAKAINESLQSAAKKHIFDYKYSNHQLTTFAKELQSLSNNFGPGTTKSQISQTLTSRYIFNNFELSELRRQKNGYSVLVLKDKEDGTTLFAVRNDTNGNMSVLRPESDLMKEDDVIGFDGFEVHPTPNGATITAIVGRDDKNISDLFAGEGIYAKYAPLLFEPKRREINFWTQYLKRHANDLPLLKELETFQAAKGSRNTFAIDEGELIQLIEKNYQSLDEPVKDMLYSVAGRNSDNIVSKTILDLRRKDIPQNAKIKQVTDFKTYEEFHSASQQWAASARSVDITGFTESKVHKDILLHDSPDKRIELYENATPEQKARYFVELRQRVQDELQNRLLHSDKSIDPELLDELTYLAHLIDKNELKFTFSGNSTSSIRGIQPIDGELAKIQTKFTDKEQFTKALKEIVTNYPIKNKIERSINEGAPVTEITIKPATQIFSNLAIKGPPPAIMKPKWSADHVCGLRIIKGKSPNTDKISIKAINIDETNRFGKPVTNELHYQWQNAASFLNEIDPSRYPYLDFYIRASSKQLNNAQFIVAMDRQTRTVYMLKGGNESFALPATLEAEQYVMKSTGKANFSSFGLLVE